MGEQISSFESVPSGEQKFVDPNQKDQLRTGINDPLPGEDGHRPIDLTTMRQVRIIQPADLVAFRLENGTLQFMSKDDATGRLANVTEKAVYREAPNGNLVEGFETDKGLVILSSRGNRLLPAAQRPNYTKI